MARRRLRLPGMLPAGAALCVAAALAWMGWGARATHGTPVGRAGASDQKSAASQASVSPERSTSHQPPPFVLPSLLPQLTNPARLTVEFETRPTGKQGNTAQRKTVTRTADRVHIDAGPNAPEWLFLRNAADDRRVSGVMVDHHHRNIVEYDESDLRNAGMGRGWADIVSLGVEPETFGSAARTGKHQTFGGFQFEQLRRKEGAQGRIRELWWSDDAALPLRVGIDDAASGIEIVVRNIRRDVDETVLRDPRQRYPEYAVMDVADYREKHHDDGPQHH